MITKELERITKTKIRKRKAYGAIKSSSQRFPNANFTDVVPREMAEHRPDVLVMQRDSVTLTDMPTEATELYAKQQMLLAAYNMFSAATTALASHPNCQQVLLMEAVPRYDGKEDLNKYGNKMLHQAKAESADRNKDRIMIGVHNLECEGGVREARYGDGRNGPVDMIHMKGSSGRVAYTRSVAAILARAGLASSEEAEQVARSQEITMERPSGDNWRMQGRRGQGGRGQGQGGRDQGQGGRRQGGQGQCRGGQRGRRQQQQQGSPFELATQNRWSAFQGNM